MSLLSIKQSIPGAAADATLDDKSAEAPANAMLHHTHVSAVELRRNESLSEGGVVCDTACA